MRGVSPSPLGRGLGKGVFWGREMRVLVHSRTLLSAKLLLRCNISRPRVRVRSLAFQPDCGLIKGIEHFLFWRWIRDKFSHRKR